MRPVRIGERCVQFRAKRLEFHRSLECLELVTEIAQPLQSIIDIEKSRLPSHRIISDPSVTMESERQRIGEVLRSIQLSGGLPAPQQWTGRWLEIRRVHFQAPRLRLVRRAERKQDEAETDGYLGNVG